MKVNRKGFTLAELLITVAILIILMGIGFVNVTEYSRNLKLNEMDGLAREVFIASQNQLSKAKSSGMLQKLAGTERGYKVDVSNDTGMVTERGENTHEEFYLIVNQGQTDHPELFNSVLLPFGAIDETMRLGGHYTVRYDYDPATVTQVYYTDNKDVEISFSDISGDTKYMNGEYTREEQKNSEFNGSKCILGFYHGSSEPLKTVIIEKPVFKVFNGDILYARVDVKDHEKMLVNLCVKGLSSKSKTTKTISAPDNIFVLDDVTSVNNHFVQLFSEEGNVFIPGEDIEIYVTVQSKDSLSNFEESDHFITNSLFAGLSEYKNEPSDDEPEEEDAVSGKHVAKIANFRHLENLSSEISGAFVRAEAAQEEDPFNPVDESEAVAFEIVKAEQVKDLADDPNDPDEQHSWNSFIGRTYSGEDIPEGNSITSASGTILSNDFKYVPVNISDGSTLVEYEGNFRKIDGIDVLSADHAGLFGAINGTFTVKDLELNNFNVKTNGFMKHSGALAGSATDLTLKNILAYNPSELHGGTPGNTPQIISEDGFSGGLVGDIVSGEIVNCAASLRVNGDRNAGGLLGYASDMFRISHSYSGAHSVNGTFPDKISANAGVNVRSDHGKAGGLVGSGEKVTVTSCYSVGSVYGSNGSGPVNGAQALVYPKREQDDPDQVNYYVPFEKSGEVINWYSLCWIYNADGSIKYPDVTEADVIESGIFTTDRSYNEEKETFNYDKYWEKDYFPALTIAELDPEYSKDESDLNSEPASVWFLERHIGDWAYPGYTIRVENRRG